VDIFSGEVIAFDINQKNFAKITVVGDETGQETEEAMRSTPPPPPPIRDILIGLWTCIYICVYVYNQICDESSGGREKKICCRVGSGCREEACRRATAIIVRSVSLST
jgi:hypothetical protein